MGYQTSYSLKVHEGEYRIQDILSELFDEGEIDYLPYAVDLDGDTYDSCKWYDHEVDMKVVSKRYPDVVFVLYGEGEEAGDMWRKYFKNGHIQRCPAKITYDDFDEKKLTRK